MSTVRKYKIYCNTEAKYVEGWGTADPTTCYTNNSHSVNANSIQVIDTVSSNTVSIKEDKIEIGRNVMIKQIIFSNVDSSTSSTIDYKFDMVTSMYSFHFATDDTNKGDELSIIINPGTALGLIAANISAGATTLQAPPALVAYGYQGFYLTLTDGTHTDELGYILSLDKVTGIVTFSTPAVHSFSSTNTVVKMSSFVMKNFVIGPPARYPFGEDVVGGTAVPVGTVVRFIYKNNTVPGDLADIPKSLTINLTLLY